MIAGGFPPGSSGGTTDTMKLAKILVPTDFSDAARRAYEQAKALAKPGGVEILLLHRLPSPIPLFPSPAEPGAGSLAEVGHLLDDFTKQVREEANRRLKGLEDEAPFGVAVTTAIEERYETHEAILERIASWEPDLVVMGTHGRQGLDKILMGSVASQVLHQAECDVMLVRPDTELFGGDGDPGSILVPVDFSEHSHRALGVARALAERSGATVHLIHVVELLHTPFTPGGLSSRFEEGPELREKYREALTQMLGETPGEVTVAEGTVEGEILWWREKLGSKLLVMGRRGMSSLKRLLLGSVTEKVARYSEVPVVVVK